MKNCSKFLWLFLRLCILICEMLVFSWHGSFSHKKLNTKVYAYEHSYKTGFVNQHISCKKLTKNGFIHNSKTMPFLIILSETNCCSHLVYMLVNPRNILQDTLFWSQNISFQSEMNVKTGQKSNQEQSFQ